MAPKDCQNHGAETGSVKTMTVDWAALETLPDAKRKTTWTPEMDKAVQTYYGKKEGPALARALGVTFKALQSRFYSLKRGV